jgi:hypothetical protein
VETREHFSAGGQRDAWCGRSRVLARDVVRIDEVSYVEEFTKEEGSGRANRGSSS